MTGILIKDESDRAFLRRVISDVPIGTLVEMGPAKRTVEQNAKLWAMLSEVAAQKEHAGRFYTSDQWKVLFMHACGQEVDFMPSLDQSTFLPYDGKSSQMTVPDMAELLSFIESWGVQNGVEFSQ